MRRQCFVARALVFVLLTGTGCATTRADRTEPQPGQCSQSGDPLRGRAENLRPYLLSMALDGYIAWPPACSNLPPLAEDPERVTFCQRLKAAVRGVLHGEQVRFRFYGFEEERLAFAEAFLVLMSLRGASPAYQGMALFVNDLVGGACQESGAAGACAEIEDLLAGLAADAEVRAEHRERCQAEAGDHATAGGCQQVIPEYVSGCLAVTEGPMEPREALRWLRRAFVCLGTAQPRVDAVSWWEVRGALAAMFESHVGPA